MSCKIDGEVPITWADAERLYPGSSAEWDEMVLLGGDFRPEGMFDVELFTFISLDGGSSLVVKQSDPEDKWIYPRSWIRYAEGKWRSPLPMSRGMLSFKEDYSYDGLAFVQIGKTAHVFGKDT
jgi:hypothetical protein